MISSYIIYVFLFCSLYFEVFLLLTYIEKKKYIKTEYLEKKDEYWPTVDIVVPCFNESKTIIATINSLLGLDYPKDKLKILVIDDGSTDDSLNTLEFFKENPQVEIHHKENGGKFTALNFGIENSKADLFGCLDADSFVDKDALKNMMPYFENQKIMAVVPSIKVHAPGNVLQKIQKIEYGWGIFVRKVLTYLNALHVTPGPFTIFRRKIFENVGKYRHAHHTEDLEMALRLQKHHYKIANSHRSIVYTVTPKTIRTLYKQRRRWSYGFLKNAIDYKFMFFKKEYGNLGFFILPLAVISIFSAIYLAINFVISNGHLIFEQVLKIATVGLSFGKIHFDWFYINTNLVSIIGLFTIIGTLILVLLSMKLSEGKLKIKSDFFYFLIIYPFIAPLWLFGAVFNTLFSKTITWR